jgi:hypothetical protein
LDQAEGFVVDDIVGFLVGGGFVGGWREKGWMVDGALIGFLTSVLGRGREAFAMNFSSSPLIYNQQQTTTHFKPIVLMKTAYGLSAPMPAESS